MRAPRTTWQSWVAKSARCLRPASGDVAGLHNVRRLLGFWGALGSDGGARVVVVEGEGGLVGAVLSWDTGFFPVKIPCAKESVRARRPGDVLSTASEIWERSWASKEVGAAMG